MKRLLLLLLLTLPAYAQNGSKIVTDANATGQTGAMQTGSRAAAVTFTFCGTGFSGPVYVDAAATSAALAQVWTTTLAGNSDCTTTYAYSPASKWYRVRWTRSAGTLNIWMNIQTGDVTAGAITGPVGGLTAGRVVLTSGATGITDDAGLTYVAATDALTTGAVAAQNLTATGLATPGAITVTPQGTGGVVTWTYKLVATLADGTTTEAGAASSTAVGNANLGAVNFNRLTWSAVPGAAGYKVYRTVTGTTPLTTGIIYTGTALTVDDTGLAGGGETAPTVDGTGVARADRVLVGDGTAAAPSVGFTDNTGIYNIGTSQLGFSAGGSSVAGLNATRLNLNVSGGLSINADTFLYRGAAAATLQLGAANVTGATPPVAQTLTVQSVGTTATADLAGADWTHKGSLGKGTAASGKHIFTVGTPQNTTVAHVASTVLTLQDTGTGGTAAPQALFADGTAAKPSVVVGSANKGFFYSAPYLGLANGDSGNYHRWNGAAYQIPSDVGNVAFGASLDLTLTRGAAATLQLGAAAANSDGVDQRLQTQGGITGTDRAAGDLDLTTGLGTGTGYSKVTISAPTRVGTGTTAQTRAVKATIDDTGVTANIGTGTATARVGGVLHVSTTAQATTGTAEEVLATYTMPANTLARDGQAVRITAWGRKANNANSITVSVRFGGIAGTIVATRATTTALSEIRYDAIIVRTGATTQAATANMGVGASFTTISTSPTQTLANALDIVVTATTATAAGDYTYIGMLVEALN